jgi:hypothetical protein
MKLPLFHPLSRKTSRSGYTLLEMMLAIFVGTLLIGVVVALGIFTSRTFFMVGNYVDMDSKSRNTIDVMSKEIRNSSALIAIGTSNPTFLLFTNATAGTTTKLSYDATAHAVTLTKTGQAARTYLTDCDAWSYSLYNRVPNITSTNITFFATTDLNQVKLVNLSWTCSRKVLGSKLNTEIVLTAQIVLRNKVQ